MEPWSDGTRGVAFGDFAHQIQIPPDGYDMILCRWNYYSWAYIMAFFLKKKCIAVDETFWNNMPAMIQQASHNQH